MQGLSGEAMVGDLIKDGSEASFMADVIDASQKTPIIVDFWAPWCGPCKTLGPVLEAAVTAAKGKVKLVKVDIDKNQAIAAQLRVQSIPMVYAFFQGRPVDAFQGNVAPSEVKAFVEKIASYGGDGGFGAALEEGEAFLAEGAAAQAAEIFAALLSESPENPAAYGGLIRAYLAAGDLGRAQALIDNTPEAIKTAPEIEAARAAIDLQEQAQNAGPLAELSAAVEADPNDLQALFDFAIALQGAGKSEEAVDALLDLFGRDPAWNDAAAKTQLFKIFEALTPKDPIVLKGRRKLSSLIFT